MLVSFSVCLRDESIAPSTLDWMYQLDGKLPYRAILSIGDGVNPEPIVAAAQRVFDGVEVIGSNAPDSWPQGKNMSFQNLVRHLDATGNTESFFWAEPDMIPLKKGWLATIEDEHLRGGRPFTGYVYDQQREPKDYYMDCVGVYPPNFMEYSPRNGMLCRAGAWDRCAGAEIAPLTHRINHLMQFVHDIDGFPPTFTDDLSLLRPGAVIFHANKDGTLIKQLSKGTITRLFEKLLPPRRGDTEKKREQIVVVCAPCAKDLDQGIHHAKWLAQLGKWPNRAVIAFDAECPAEKIQELHTLLQCSFNEVERFLYPTPPDKSYPAVANFAFARVAEFMAGGTAPWFWMESDTIALKRDWLETLQKEYDAAGKPFMGPVVKETGYGHANGSAVYPADTVQRIPRALKQTKVAWDYAAREEINGDVHDASYVIQHLWGLIDGRASATNGAQPPVQFTREMAKKLIAPGAVVLHRVKDNSLVDLLMAGGWR